MKRSYQEVQMGLPAVWVFLFFMLLTIGGKINSMKTSACMHGKKIKG